MNEQIMNDRHKKQGRKNLPGIGWKYVSEIEKNSEMCMNSQEERRK